MSVQRFPVSIRSLRDAIAFLDTQDGQLIRSRTAFDPAAELSGVYCYVGAGGTVMRPTTVDGASTAYSYCGLRRFVHRQRPAVGLYTVRQ